MPKPMYVWSGSAWVSVASEVESLANYATQSYADNVPGNKMIIPTSVTVGSGSGSVAAQGTINFSGASSVSINGCFSSAYQNYRIIVNLTTSAISAQVIGLKLRASGTDTSTGYYGIDVYTGTAAGPARSYESNVARANITNGGNNKTVSSVDIFSPFESSITALTAIGFEKSTSDFYSDFCSYYLDNTTSYDGFTIYPNTSGTITGTIRVYGYKNG